MTFRPGDRVRVTTTGDDGLPLVRYGSVGGMAGRDGPVVVMLDGELGGDVLDLSELEAVSITTVELRLPGNDLIDEPASRRASGRGWIESMTSPAESASACHR